MHGSCDEATVRPAGLCCSYPGPRGQAQRCGWFACALSAPVPAAISWPEPVCRSQPAGTGLSAGHRAPVRSAPVSSTLARFASARSASVRSAPVRSAPSRSAPVSLAPPRSAPQRSARTSLAASRSARARTAWASTAPVQVELFQEALTPGVLRGRGQAGRLVLEGDPVHGQRPVRGAVRAERGVGGWRVVAGFRFLAAGEPDRVIPVAGPAGAALPFPGRVHHVRVEPGQVPVRSS